MSRPTFLVAEPEPEQALSSRKLLLETFKFNVITAHSASEMLELLRQFPKVDAVILHTNVPGFPAKKLISEVKKTSSHPPVIEVGPNAGQVDKGADHMVNSHRPEDLLRLLQRLFGDARTIDGK